MSLINDALKRTQQTTQTQEPPRLEELELRPIEPIHPAPTNDGSGAKRILWIMVVLVLAANAALWLIFKDRGSKDLVAARTADTELITEPVVDPVPVPETTTPATAPAEVAEPATSSASPIAVPEVPGTNLEVSPIVVAERPEFKLKTIVSHPVRPSAMINNRVLFVGDRVEGYTVKIIGQNDVTLAKGDDEVVVSLP